MSSRDALLSGRAPVRLPVVPGTPRMLVLRGTACAITRRFPQAPVSLGVLGTLGFVAACVAALSGRLDGLTYLLAATGSVALYLASLLVGCLGCPHELCRRLERSHGGHPRGRAGSA